MARMVALLSDALPLLLALLQLLAAPYTKVEESFQVQATHDLLYTKELSDFDHLEFSGVVPRSFIGPLLLAGMSLPAKALWAARGWHKESMLVVARACLCLLFALSFSFLRRCFAARFAPRGSSRVRLRLCIALVACCQFHLLFYSSRPLANTFASVTVNVALGYWIRSGDDGVDAPSRNKAAGRCVAWLAVTCILFRCDMLLLSACIIAASLLYGWLSVRTLLTYGVLTSIVTIGISVPIDSYFWRRLLWPELEVLLFNIVPRRDPHSGELHSLSEQWGTEPFAWYFSRALPKALLGTGALLPLAAVQRIPRTWGEIARSPREALRTDGRVVRLLLPCFLFVFLYSFLAHKELRFIAPILPLLSCIAGLGLWKVWSAGEVLYAGGQKRDRDNRPQDNGAAATPPRVLEQQLAPPSFGPQRVLQHACHAALVLSLALSALSLYASSLNYPGGHALHRFHALTLPSLESHPASTSSHSTAAGKTRPLVHLCNLAATTGSSRFGQHDSLFRYSKLEGLELSQLHLEPFDFALVEALRGENAHIPPQVEGFEPLRTGEGGSSPDDTLISAFSHVRFPSRANPFDFAVEQRPALWIMQRKTAWTRALEDAQEAAPPG